MFTQLPEECPAYMREMLESINIPAACHAWFWADYRARRVVLWKEALAQQAQVSKDNFNTARPGINGVGQAMFRIAPLLQQVLDMEFGPRLARSREFQKELIRDNDWACFRPAYKAAASIIKPTIIAAA